MADNLIVKSSVRNAVSNMSVSKDVYDALDRRIRELLRNASDRARSNGRKTIMVQDL